MRPAKSNPTRDLVSQLPLSCILCLLTVSTFFGLTRPVVAQESSLTFAEQELDTRLRVGYAVRLIDMNDDDRLDICIVDSKRILWLENPNWNEHVLVETPDKTDNVCFAPYDIDGDGKLDFAVGADWTVNTREGGTIHWLSRTGAEPGSWMLRDIGSEPTTHRMRWADLDGDDRAELVVLPLMGRNSSRPNFAESGVRVLSFAIPKDPINGPWEPEVINDEMHVTHNLWPCDFDRDGDEDLLVVSFEGVNLLERNDDGSWTRTLIGIGDQESSPNRGASEIKLGRISDDETFVATIEPWHGNQVVVYRKPDTERPSPGNDWLWERQVVDANLKWGHAVYCANLDDDPEDELIIGVRDNLDERHRCGLRLYDLAEDGKTWNPTLVDPGGVAIEDLVAGDLNGDGRIDVVAVGRATHNVKIYWNETK